MSTEDAIAAHFVLMAASAWAADAAGAVGMPTLRRAAFALAVGNWLAAIANAIGWAA